MAYSVRVSRFSTGERFAHIIVVDTQLPHFESTIYNLAMLRGTQLATSTIESILRALKIFLLFCDMRGISLSTRMQNGLLFEAGELDELLRLCRKPLENIEAMVAASNVGNVASSAKRLCLFPSNKSEAEVGSYWIRNRIVYIRNYIDYLASVQCDRFVPDHTLYLSLAEQRKSAYNKLTNLLPSDKGRDAVNQRMGLVEEEQDALFELIEPTSPKNIWVGRHCRVRNELMTRMFIKLGVRRGELAGLTVREIDFRARTLTVIRNADNKEDYRSTEPNAKTRSRVLPLSADFLQLIKHYVFQERALFARASGHPFLFVANGGRPLSVRAVNKVFEVLVKRSRAFGELFPHILRHTFNDNLSTLLDAKKTPEAEEERIRSELNGWKPGSGTAATYTKRTTQRRARQASLELQEKQPVKPINDE